MAGHRSFKAFYPDQHEAAYQALSAAERAQASLLRRFEALAALVPADLAEHQGVQSLLKGAKEDVATQSHATRGMLNYIPREFRRPDSAGLLAQKVFGTPELLEKILLLTDTRTAFESMRVSRDFFNTIEGSLKLQRKLALMADADAHGSLKANWFFDEGSGVDFKMSMIRLVDTQWGNVLTLEMNATACEDSIRKPGPRLRSALITQPPIKHLEVRVSCCSTDRSYYRTPTPITTMQSETGITVGEVRDQIVRLREAYRLCPHADLLQHEEDGTVDPKVTFTGDLMLKDDDYAVLQAKEQETQRSRQADEEDKFDDRIRPYMMAKLAGKFL